MSMLGLLAEGSGAKTHRCNFCQIVVKRLIARMEVRLRKRMLTSNTPVGHTPCIKAAFAENLYVAAMATDGWSRLSGLDASGVPVAFALEPA